MRCSPSVDHPALSEFDIILRTPICKITNCDLSEIQWLQAGLSIRDGGLGIRSVSSLTLPTFFGFSGRIPFTPRRHPLVKPDSFSLCTCHVGWVQWVVYHPIYRCQEKNLSGISQVSFPTKQQSNPICGRNTEKPPFSLQKCPTRWTQASICRCNRLG